MTNKSVFPHTEYYAARMEHEGIEQHHPGLTLREHYAGLVLQGIVASMGLGNKNGTIKKAVEYADALIKELGI
jgi:hypothetical protein